MSDWTTDSEWSSGDDAIRRAELGDFLQVRRASLRPEDVNIPRRGRRRVTGLRRHEVADLAAVSVTWYTWLEQGRPIKCTSQVLDSLATALKLNEAERRHLRRLGGSPVSETTNSRREVAAELKAILEDLLPSPACLLEPTDDFVAWNRSYALIFDDPSTYPPERRNALFVMLSSNVRDRLDNWESDSCHAIGSLRAEAAKHLGEPRFAEIVNLLTAESDLFREAWPLHEVRRFVTQGQVIHHPDVGEIRMQWIVLRPLGQSSLMLMVHRLLDDESRDRARQLLATDAPRAARDRAGSRKTGGGDRIRKSTSKPL